MATTKRTPRPRKKKTTEKADVYATVTDKIIEALNAGTVPWRKPWDPRIGMPLSMSTGKRYRGINILLLSIASQFSNLESPYWGTYKKITDLGGQVRKGETSTLITLWKSGARDVIDATTGDTERKRWAILRSYVVFNACQADGLPERFYKAPGGNDLDPIGEAQTILDGYFDNGPRLTHTAGQGAYYAPFLDEVVLPPMPAFDTAEGYYSTAFHEATHSTGHKSRLNREGIARHGHMFGDEVYSKEELVAEMGAAMLCGIAGIEQAAQLDQSAAYIQSWIEALKGDTKLLVSAAGAAQKAADLIQGITFEDEKPSHPTGTVKQEEAA